ncbi:MAG: hypothetical protein ACK5BM_03150, partial [Bacteroidota bacterium]
FAQFTELNLRRENTLVLHYLTETGMYDKYFRNYFRWHNFAKCFFILKFIVYYFNSPIQNTPR